MSSPADVSDRALLERLCRGRDAGALAEVVRRYGGLVYGVCQRRTGSAANGACLTVFRELFDHPDIVRGALPLWLHASAARRGDGGPGHSPAAAEAEWMTVAPALDVALAALPPQPRWHLLMALGTLPARGHARAYAQEFSGALAQPIADAVALLAARLGAVAPQERGALMDLLDRNLIDMPPPALAAELGRLALSALPTNEVETLTPGARRAKVVWSIAIGGLVFVVIMAVVFWAIAGWTATHRKTEGGAPTAQ